MYRYKYNTSYHHKSKKARRVTVVAVIACIGVLVAGVYVGIDVYKQLTRKDTTESREVYSSVQGASINLFRTEYFQFQANKNWQEVPGEEKPGHFVYRSFNGPLVEHDMVIDVNSAAVEIVSLARTTRVLPVQIESNGKLSVVDGAGEHCGTLVPKTNTVKLPVRVTQKQVSFICSVDAVLYQVQVGVVGGDTKMVITRPNGAKASYQITYRNLKFTPDDAEIRSIVETFQAR
jgi:hypothetical protein